jgi:PleD family two-component response regulator
MSENITPKATILVVAESGTAVGDLKAALAAAPYQMYQAKETREAIEILSSLNPQTALTIVDLELPGGLALVGLLLHRVPKTTKLIAASSFFDVSFLGRLKEMGVDEAVQYPASLQAWRRTIASVLNGKEGTPRGRRNPVS